MSEHHWNAEDMGCGMLIMELSTRVKALESGQVITVNSSNPGAIKDIPAWCRMTGNTLLEANPPTFTIQRK